MKDEYLLESKYEEEMSEEYWAYQMYLTELAEKEIRLMDELVEEKYAIELELYNRQ